MPRFFFLNPGKYSLFLDEYDTYCKNAETQRLGTTGLYQCWH